MTASFRPLINGKWIIQVNVEDGDPIDGNFVASLTDKLTVRTVGASIVIEAKEKS